MAWSDAEQGVKSLICPNCEHRTIDLEVPRCPACGGDMVPAVASPSGVVWATTVVRIPIEGFTPPYGLAYVDLEGGPRILARFDAEEMLEVDQVVRIAQSEEGLFRVVDEVSP